MSKKSEIIWLMFGILLLGSLVVVGWSLNVYHHTPMLVHDTLHGVGQLSDTQREALYPALLKAYRPVVFGGAGALLAWILFTMFVLRLLRRSAADHNNAALAHAQTNER
jgi:hypothetical protein